MAGEGVGQKGGVRVESEWRVNPSNIHSWK